MMTIAMRVGSRCGVAAVGVLALVSMWTAAPPLLLAATPKQQVYATPEAAVQALVAATKAGDTTAMLNVLGPDAKSIIDSGDEVADRESRENFTNAYDAAHALETTGETRVELDVGADKWPFPIPLVKESKGWRWDTAAGKDEIINRRVGRNELAAIQVCLAYVDAQREYFMLSPEGDTLHHYALLIVSTPGKRDGLYWEAAEGEPPSPLGLLMAQTQAEGYSKTDRSKVTPYHGYYYRVLTGQGPAANGGAYDYVVRGKMFGGFALVAYPAEWGNSGVMTFIVNQDGVVFEKDLGPDSAARARKIERFDPDSGWTRVQDEGQPAPTSAPPS